MEETDESSNMKLGLNLGLGLTKYEPKMDNSKKNKRVFSLDFSIPLHRSDLDHAVEFVREDKKRSRKNGVFSGCKEVDDNMDYSKNCSRKKLRLSKDQITLLEDSFEQHSTLTMAQKQALAEKLNLKPRQVEVWFQNRRARTKLKQTEIDCEFLKKKFERLSDENRHLHNQLLELRSVAKIGKVSPPPLPLLQKTVAATAPSLHQLFYEMPKEAAIHRTCSSCGKILKGEGGGGGGGGSDGGKKEAAAGETVIEVMNQDYDLNHLNGLAS